MVWLGTHALDSGAMSVFFFCFRQREKILNLIEGGFGRTDDAELFPHRRSDDGPAGGI